MKTPLLVYLWECQRDKCGWLSHIMKYLDPTEKQLEYIQEVDDEFQQRKREGPPGCSEAISAAIKEVPLESRREMRLRYLRWSEDGLKERLSSIRVEARGLQGNREFEEKLLFAVTNSRMLTDKLWQTGEEIKRMSTIDKDEEFQLMPDEIERAKAFPIEKLLGKKRGERIPCHFHGGKDKNMLLKGYGYCFVCSKNIDSLNWLVKVEGRTFREAVKELS